jgi:cellobiose epimerase
MPPLTLWMLLLMLPSAPQDSAFGAAQIPRVEKLLYKNIAPFWYPRSVDRTNGGYHVDFDITGAPKPGGTRMIVTQGRMLWYFAHMARAGFGGLEYLDAAGHGFRYLRDKMWDEAHGGFYWELDAAGKVIAPRKHLYGQAFALYGVSEYYLASRRPEVLEFANRIFDVMDAKGYDREYGGYVEFFNEDWTPVPESEYSPMGYQGALKLMNTHLHLLEAFTTYYRASARPLARERLLELMAIQSNTVVRKKVGACTDKYERDWTPHPDPKYARVSYGHDVENVWLLLDACKAAGVSYHPYMDLFRSLWDYALAYGFDGEKGGFFDSGPFDKPADARDKWWWTQAEAMVSALYMYRLTGDTRYRTVFEKTLDWVEKNQADGTNGEWYWIVPPDGKPSGDKGNPWKAAYHTGRAMMECLQLLGYTPVAR